jgi:hypothetical protein
MSDSTRKKTIFTAPAGKFAGCKENGFWLNPEKTRSIRDFPTPSKITDNHSFYGLCQHVGNKIAKAVGPISPLLKQNSGWNWGPDQEESFQKAREELAVSHELVFYHPEREITLHVDASRLNGLRFILKQKDANTNEWRMVQAGSRFYHRPKVGIPWLNSNS